MSMKNRAPRLVKRASHPRRAALGLLSLGLVVAGSPAVAHAASSATSHSRDSLPVSQMEQVLQADGHVSNGVLEVDVDRSDITGVRTPDGKPILPGFQLEHTLTFQMVSHHRAMFNGDFALRASETQKVIDAIRAQGLTFQAFHQHLYDISPLVWFIHTRGTGNPVDLARRVRAVEAVTGTPLPQSTPAQPPTPLPVTELAGILGGDATVGSSGVVTVVVPRAGRIRLGHKTISPELNVSTNVEFEPLPGGKAAVVPDFSMTASEIPGVTDVMRSSGWDDGCLYNQETDERPQLYFSHFYKSGDPVALARQIRQAVDRTDVEHQG